MKQLLAALERGITHRGDGAPRPSGLVIKNLFAPQCPPLGLDGIVDRVIVGRLITLVGSGAAERTPPEVSALPVSDLPPTRLALAWPQGASRPAVSAFVRSARAVHTRRAAPGRPGQPGPRTASG